MKKTLEDRIVTLRGTAAKAKEPSMLADLVQEIADTEKQIPAVAHLPQLWCDDVTPEQLVLGERAN